MNTKQQIIRVDAGNVLDGLFDHHTTQHPDEVRNLVVAGPSGKPPEQEICSVCGSWQLYNSSPPALLRSSPVRAETSSSQSRCWQLHSNALCGDFGYLRGFRNR